MANYTYNVSSYSYYGSLYYSFSGSTSGNNPDLSVNVSSGDTLTFNMSAPGHPFYIKTSLGSGSSGAYSTGVSGNGTASGGSVVLTVSDSTPSTLYYQCGNHYSMNGQINLNISSTTTTTSTTSTSTTSTSTTSTSTTSTSTTSTSTTSTTPTTTTTTTTTTTAAPDETTTTTTTTTITPDATTPAPTTTVSPDLSVTTTTLGPVALSANPVLSDPNLLVVFTPSNFTKDTKTEISWFLTQGSVRTTVIGDTKDSTMFSGSSHNYSYSIPLSRFASEAAEYTFLVKTFNDTESSTVSFTWISPGTPTTTSTTTTTDSPLDIVVETNDLQECPCGEIKFPRGGHFFRLGTNTTDNSLAWQHLEPNYPRSGPNVNSLRGLRVLLKEGELSKDYGLIHPDYVYLKSEEEFVTSTNNITDDITPDKLALYIDTDVFYRMSLENVISITVKDEVNNKTLGHKQFGSFGTRQKIKRSALIDKPSFVINLTGTTNLKNNAIMIVVKSLCQYDTKPCCDSLPRLMRVDSSGDAQYGKKGSGICIPMDMFYTGEEINYITTTTQAPEEITFADQLSVSLGASEATLSAKMSSSYGSDIKFWWEITSTSPTTRLTTIQTAKSNETVTFTDKRSGSATYRISIVHPKVLTSNSETVNIPTTSAPTTTTSTTAIPATTVAPLVTSISFNDIGAGNGFDSDIIFDRCLPRMVSTSSGAGIKKTIDLYTDINSINETIKLEVDTDIVNASGPTTYQWQLFDVEANCGQIVSDINWDLVVPRETTNPWLYVDSAKGEDNILVNDDIKYYIVRCKATNNNVSTIADLLYFRNY